MEQRQQQEMFALQRLIQQPQRQTFVPSDNFALAGSVAFDQGQGQDQCSQDQSSTVMRPSSSSTTTSPVNITSNNRSDQSSPQKFPMSSDRQQQLLNDELLRMIHKFEESKQSLTLANNIGPLQLLVSPHQQQQQISLNHIKEEQDKNKRLFILQTTCPAGTSSQTNTGTTTTSTNVNQHHLTSLSGSTIRRSASLNNAVTYGTNNNNPGYRLPTNNVLPTTLQTQQQQQMLNLGSGGEMQQTTTTTNIATHAPAYIGSHSMCSSENGGTCVSSSLAHSASTSQLKLLGTLNNNKNNSSILSSPKRSRLSSNSSGNSPGNGNKSQRQHN